MTDTCALCRGDLNPYDKGVWKQVIGWVGGPRKDSMRLREDTGKYAHDACVAKAQSGQDPESQPSLEDEPEVKRYPKLMGVPEDLLSEDD